MRPENTLAAFEHGLALGADGLEFDVQLSGDGMVIVHHDATLERTTSGTGRLSSLTAAQLAEIDAGHRFTDGRSPGFPFRGRGLGVPTLREVLRRHQVPLIIELKSSSPALASKTIEEVRLAGAVERVSLGSFYYRVLRAARACEPRIATGASQEETRWALYRSWVGWPLGRTAYREFQVPERSGRTTIVSRQFIAHAHRAEVTVKVWTVDDRADIDRLLDWGVDAIITDRPDVAAGAVAARYG